MFYVFPFLGGGGQNHGHYFPFFETLNFLINVKGFMIDVPLVQ